MKEEKKKLSWIKWYVSMGDWIIRGIDDESPLHTTKHKSTNLNCKHFQRKICVIKTIWFMHTHIRIPATQNAKNTTKRSIEKQLHGWVFVVVVDCCRTVSFKFVEWENLIHAHSNVICKHSDWTAASYSTAYTNKGATSLFKATIVAVNLIIWPVYFIPFASQFIRIVIRPFTWAVPRNLNSTGQLFNVIKRNYCVSDNKIKW